KFLGCLSNEWEPKVTAIEESKDLKTMEMEELLGSLMTHEVKLSKKMKNQEEKKPQEDKRKEIALKSTPKEDIRRKFKKNFNKGDGSKNDFDTCIKCNKLGHMKADCRMLKKNKALKKALIAWYVSGDESSDKETTTNLSNLCFMPIEDDEVDSYPYTLDELQDAFDNLLIEFKKEYSKVSSRSKQVQNIQNEKILVE
ncbi:zf-CCHC domain-containing protein/UBN2 domain-containing protein, partial [Cephalotus follicularis]